MSNGAVCAGAVEDNRRVPKSLLYSSTNLHTHVRYTYGWLQEADAIVTRMITERNVDNTQVPINI